MPAFCTSKEEATGYFSVLLIAACTFMAAYCPQPLMATISKSYSVPQATATLLMSVVIFPFAFAPFVYGKILNRIRFRRLLAVVVPVSGICLVLASLVRSFEFMLACRIVQGLLFPAVLLCLTAYLASCHSGKTLQGKMVGYATATMIGSYAGRMLAGIISAYSSAETAMLIMGVVQLCATIPVLFFHDGTSAQNALFRMRDVIKFLGKPSQFAVLMIGPICIFSFSAIVNFFPFYVRALDENISDFFIGFTYVVGIFGAVFSASSARLQRLLRGEWNLLLVSAILFTAAILFFLGKTPLCGVLALFCSNAIFAIIYSNCPGIVNRISPYDAKTTNSLYLCIYYLFSALGSVLPIIVYSHFSLDAFVALLMAASCVNIIIVYWAKKHVVIA